MSDNTEVWKPVVGYDGLYEVSNYGRVRSLSREGVYRGRWGMCRRTFPGAIKSIATTNAGYKYVCLKHPNEKSIKYLVHRLVMAAFVGPVPEGEQVNHIDGDKSNNRPANLEYCTMRENLLHCTRVLKKKRGESQGHSKLKEADIRSIREDGRVLREIASDYGVTLQAIWLVKKRKNWAHIE